MVGGAIVLAAGSGGVTSLLVAGKTAACGAAAVCTRVRALLMGRVSVACGEGCAGSLCAGAGDGSVAGAGVSMPGGFANVGSLAAMIFGAGALNSIPVSYA